MNKHKRKKLGLPPGTIVFTGKRKVEKIIIHYLQYDLDNYTEQTLDNQIITKFHNPVDHVVQWYDIRGLHDTELIEAFGKVFNLHRLALEDIADPFQRPKFDQFEDGFLVTAKALAFQPETAKIRTEQVAIYCGKGFVLSFQEDEADLFFHIKERVRNKSGRIRERGADYLAYAMLDALVDNYFLVLDEIGERIVGLEDEVLEGSENRTKGKIHNLRREVQKLRKNIVPLREVVNQFAKPENKQVEELTIPFLRDLYDHIVQTLDLVESYREALFSLHDLHLSEISMRMNNVMQILTIISTIFIPLTFLAGIYGMNFEYMPELGWKYAYFILLGVMAVIFISLIFFFRRKRWL